MQMVIFQLNAVGIFLVDNEGDVYQTLRLILSCQILTFHKYRQFVFSRDFAVFHLSKNALNIQFYLKVVY